MGTIAKGEITLSPVNDAYTVSLTPASCTVQASFNGDNPNFSNAQGVLTVKRGSVSALFHVASVSKSSEAITVDYSAGTVQSLQFQLSGASFNGLDGWVEFSIVTDDGFGYAASARFAFSVIRESTMLDWIQDWEGGKTKVGDTYVMTPKLFVGKKEDVLVETDGEWGWKENALTGVYIGPDLLGRENYGVGIYGYLNDCETFHLNGNGGFIGGWTFNSGGLQSSNGVVNMLSAGTIYAQDPSSVTPYWGIYANGSATFAHGNVTFYPDGSASFAGSIASSSGNIGSWYITANGLYSGSVLIDSANKYIGIAANSNWYAPLESDTTMTDASTHKTSVQNAGGVALFWRSSSNFGMVAYNGSNRVMQAGSVNFIAGWNFNHQAIWTGSETPYLTQGAYATNEGELTVAPNGLRSQKWYIDANGKASFVGGSVFFDTNKAQMFGWLMRVNRLSSSHAALSSLTAYSGLFVSPADLSEVSATSLAQTISGNGGFYIYSDSANSIMKSYDKQGHLGFYLSTSGYNSIGNWSFNYQSIYIGNSTIDDNGFTSDSGSMILATSGLIGHKWRLNADGSGAVADGNISWAADGSVAFADAVTLSWSNLSGALGSNFTRVSGNTIYTGTINADNITSGTLDAKRIDADTLLSKEDKWALLQSGAGYLACRNIIWDTDGNCEFKGSIKTSIKNIESSDAIALSGGGYRVNTDLNLFCSEQTDIELPTNIEMEGTRVLIYNGCLKKSRTDKTTCIITQNSSRLLGLTQSITDMQDGDNFGYSSIQVQAGSVELLAVKIDGMIRWAIIGCNAGYIMGNA